MSEDQTAEPDEPADDADPADEDVSETESTDTEASETEAADGDDESTDAGFERGDFVEIAYTARTADGGQLVDTTDAEVAEAEGVDQDGQEFKPRTIVLGEGHIFEAVEEDIYGREVGEEGSVTIPAEEAFGTYDPDAVETVSADKIDEDDRYPGARVHLDNQHGYVETIIGGRARVDFNHPLAGEDVEYDYELIGEVEDREQRAAGLFEMYLDVEPELRIETEEVEEEVLVEPDESDDDNADDADEETADSADETDDEPVEPEYETELVEKESLYVESTPQLTMNQQWMFSKGQIAQDVMDKVGVDRVVIQEVIEGPGGGLPGMMGGMGGMGGGDLEAALEDADVDADELVEELEADAEE